MTNDIDLHVGKRLRRRRRLLGPNPEIIAADVLSKKETMDLVRAYYSMGEGPRKHLLDLAKSLEANSKPSTAALRLVTP